MQTDARSTRCAPEATSIWERVDAAGSSRIVRSKRRTRRRTSRIGGRSRRRGGDSACRPMREAPAVHPRLQAHGKGWTLPDRRG